MDMYKTIREFATDYVTEMNKARTNDDWDEMSAIHREAQRCQRELGQIVKAVNILHQYGLTVQAK